MKRSILSLILSLFFVTNIYGVDFEYMSNYRIPSYDTVEEYNYLVGKIVTFIPIANSYNSKMVNKFFYMRDFEVLKVKKGRSQSKKVVKRMEWKIKDISTNELFKIVIYIGDRNVLDQEYDKIMWDDEVRIMDIPFYDMKKWQNECKSLLGKTYTHPLVKAQYKVTACSFDIIDGQYEEIIEVQNSIDHSKYRYIRQNVLEECFKEDLRKNFFTKLVRVEKPENPEIQYGEISVVTDELSKYSYEDNFISFIVIGFSNKFTFSLINKSQYSLKLLWDDASFVGIDGSASKILHNGINYDEREKTQPPTTIIRGANVDDVIIPTQNLFYSNKKGVWDIKSYYPSNPSGETKQVQIMLPIQIMGVTNEYVFVFDVNYEYVHPERLNI